MTSNRPPMTGAPDPRPRTAAALVARHGATEAALSRVHDAVGQLKREKAQPSIAAVARRAKVQDRLERVA